MIKSQQAKFYDELRKVVGEVDDPLEFFTYAGDDQRSRNEYPGR